MRFSVIVPAHNSSETIRKTLDSIKSQTYTDYECVVIADACTDDTADTARSYGFKVLEVDLHNEGLGRNLGIENTTGEWLLFIDSDDWYLHEFVFEQLAERIKDNDADAICFDIVWKHIGVVGAISGRNGEYYPHCTNKCWRRSFIGDTRFPNIKPASDSGFHKLIMQKKPKFDVWRMPMYYYDFLRSGSYSDELGITARRTKEVWGIK